MLDHNRACLDCTKQLIQAELSEVHWKPYALPNAESQRLRDQMRGHAWRDTDFKVWTPNSNVLNLEARYEGINPRLEQYVSDRA